MNELDIAAGELLHLSGLTSQRPPAILIDNEPGFHWPEEHASQPSSTNSAVQTRQSYKRVRGSNVRPNPCHICGKTYERVDHLNRHLKSHDNTRPFQCIRCAKGFNRADLLRRHTATHGSDGNNTVKKISSDRAVRACKACAASKSKCDDRKPCTRCQDKRIACEYVAVIQDLPLPQYDSDIALATHYKDDVVPQNQTKLALGGKDESYKGVTQPASDSAIHAPLQEQPQQHLYAALEGHKISEARHSLSMSANPTAFSTESANIVSFDWQENMLFQIDAANFGQDLDFQFSSFDWDVNGYNGLLLPDVVTNQVSDESGSVTLRHEAFKRSPWLWVPTSKDYAFAGQDDGLLIAEDSTVPSANLMKFINSRMVDERVDQVARDKIFALVMAESPRAVQSFPSAELLDNLLQIFFLRDSVRNDRWIHVPTFRTSKAIPELLVGMISSGCTFISDPAIWKMGLALQEIARFAVAARLEKDNRRTRDLDSLQAYMLWIDIGLWSGFSRVMEIAEAFEQPMLTMLRRAGALTRPRYVVITPQLEDTGEVLETKWASWVKLESFKRLVFRLFLHDMQNSIANLVTPLISYAEMTLPLPAPCKLWNAKTAEEWKSISIELNTAEPGAIPSLADSLRNISSLELFRDHVDIQMSCLLLIFSHWGQIWTYNESRQFLSKGATPTSQLRLTSQQQELYQDLQSFCASIIQIADGTAMSDMVSQLLKMSLFVSIEDLQRFAGKSGEEEARQTYPIIRDWIESADARHAAWHAGQVLRTAREFMPTQLTGFFAIALYHASLTLWAYGLASHAARRRGPRGTSTPVLPTNAIPVFLDGAECRESRSFLHFGQGNPGLTIDPSKQGAESNLGSVEDSRILMAIAKQVFRSNFPLSDEALPPLVENIRNLMSDLGDLATVPNLRSTQAGAEW